MQQKRKQSTFRDDAEQDTKQAAFKVCRKYSVSRQLYITLRSFHIYRKLFLLRNVFGLSRTVDVVILDLLYNITVQKIALLFQVKNGILTYMCRKLLDCINVS